MPGISLDPDKPISLVLGAGGVRGVAHLGVLEVLRERGYHFNEMVGTSVGALLIAFYAAAGLELPEIKRLWLSLTTRHLLAWAWLRRVPENVRNRFAHRAGIIPEFIHLLSSSSGRELHHGVERIGMVCYDVTGREEILFHNLAEEFPLAEAARGSAAIPGFFPSRRCVVAGREMRLVDGGVTNGLPVDKLFAAPFAPRQIVVVDVSNRAQARTQNLTKVASLCHQHPDVPVVTVTPDTLGQGTLIYRQPDLQQMLDAGRREMEGFFA